MIRNTIVAAILVALLGAGCSFRPVYSDNSASPNASSLAFNLAWPNNRREQIVYQELSLRFATSTALGTPELRVSTSAGHGRLGMAKTNFPTYRATVNVTAVVTLNGETLFKATRVATAQYSVASSQVLADQTARQEAEERATKSAAESLRLALLSQFTRDGNIDR